MNWECLANIARNDYCYYLSVLTKRTYKWDVYGNVSFADEQLPITMDIELEEHEQRTFKAVKTGLDSWPFKYRTDVVVHGAARSPRPVPHLLTQVQVGDRIKSVLVFGDRYVDYRGPKRVAFSEPKRFEALPLSWFNAYGGMDPTELPKSYKDTPTAMGNPVFDLFPGVYPRNPAGVGFFVNDTREILAQGPSLPNQEDPEHLLRPETFLVGAASHWWRCPLPQSYGWVRSLWFPRCIHAGSKPYHLPDEAHYDDLVELRREEITLEDFTTRDFISPLPTLHMANEASSGLILPCLEGDEPVRLRGFSAEGDMGFVLPNERAKIEAKADGKPLATSDVRMHTLYIDADKSEFFVLTAHRYDLDDRWAEELIVKPAVDAVLDRFEISVDETQLTSDHWLLSDDED